MIVTLDEKRRDGVLLVVEARRTHRRVWRMIRA
jgi:hypothetical protein